MNKVLPIKNAWEYRIYDFWNKRDSSPMDKGKQILKNPIFLDELEGRYGTIDLYSKEVLGLSSDDIELLKSHLLE